MSFSPTYYVVVVNQIVVIIAAYFFDKYWNNVSTATVFSSYNLRRETQGIQADNNVLLFRSSQRNASITRGGAVRMRREDQFVAGARGAFGRN